MNYYDKERRTQNATVVAVVTECWQYRQTNDASDNDSTLFRERVAVTALKNEEKSWILQFLAGPAKRQTATFSNRFNRRC